MSQASSALYPNSATASKDPPQTQKPSNALTRAESEPAKTKFPLFGSAPQTSQQKQEEEKKAEPEIVDYLEEELSAEGLQEVERIVDEFIGAFESKENKEKAI